MDTTVVWLGEAAGLHEKGSARGGPGEARREAWADLEAIALATAEPAEVERLSRDAMAAEARGDTMAALRHIGEAHAAMDAWRSRLLAGGR